MSVISANQNQAAVLVAEDEMDNKAIAAACGITDRTLLRWKRDPDFAAAVVAHITRLGQELSRYAIARKDKRVAEYQRRWNALKQVQEERAEDLMLQHQPGGTTGLLTAQVIPGGRGYAYVVDHAVLSAQLALEKQAAQEVGQWSEKSEVTGKDGGPIPHHHTLEMGGFSDDELRSIIARAGGAGS